MGAPSLTYTLTNGTAADASQVMQDFNDLLNGITDGTKDLSISALTVAGTATFNGACNFGNATGDDMTFTGYVASNFLPKTASTYTLGSTAQVWKSLSLDNGATDGGAVYFNSSTTSFLKSSADGLTASFGGFTGVALPAAVTGVTSMPTAAFVAPTIQKFTSGTAATYTTPSSPRTPLYLIVEMVGGGGGGCGSGTAAGTAAGAGTASTWSALTLSAGGGAAGVFQGGPAAGGTASLGTGTGLAMNGQAGGASGENIVISTTYMPGTYGGMGFFGGGSGSAQYSGSSGSTPAANSGGGGGGGSNQNAALVWCGNGGGAGGYVRAYIGSPAGTYTYTVGAAGSAGGAGTGGYAGGAGAAGIILVSEFYQ